MNRKRCLVASTLSLGVCLGVQAQNAAPGTESNAKSTAGANTPVLEEVVVTAERRTTNLQTTGIAASVFTGVDLQNKGVMSVDQLQFVAPSVTIENFGQGNDFNIRGIGKGEHNTQTSTGVITYRDGLATFPGYFQDEPFYDIASIEILRGPQGTFVGQNATGGAVVITEANPTLDGVHGYVMGQYGNYNDVLVQGAVNLPLSDDLAVRLAFNDERRDSFYEHVGGYDGNPGNLRVSSFRISALWTPIDALSVLFKTDYNYIDQGAYPADPANATNDPFKITANAHQLAIDQFGRSVLKVDYKFADGVTLRSISGYQYGRTAYDGDLDGTNQGNLTFADAVDERVWSQELNLISPDSGLVTWVVGASYQYNEYDFPIGRYDVGYPPGVFDILIAGLNPESSSGEFGQLSFNLPAGVQLQLGARYSQFKTTNRVYEGFPELATVLPDFQSFSQSKVTGKAAINWTIDRTNFVYAFVGTGVKPGGLNVPSTAALPSAFESETVTDYEIGWKASFLDDHLRTQLGAYYSDYDNFQVTVSQPDAPTLMLEINDPSRTTIYGLEAQSQAAVGAFSVDFGASFLHSRLGTFFAGDPRVAGTALLCNPGSGPAGSGCIDLSGKQQAYAPTFNLNIGGQYVFQVSQGATLTPRLNFGHVGSQWASLFENAELGDHLDPRNLLSGQLSYEKGGWTVTGYGMNLTDEHYVSAVISGLRFAGAPRQYGLRLAKTF